MPVSIFSCTLDRDTAELADFPATGLRGSDGSNGGSYKLKYNIEMQTSCGPRNALAQAFTASPHPVPSPWATYSYLGDVDPHSYVKNYNVARNPKALRWFFVTVNFEPAAQGEIIAGVGTPTKAEPDPLKRPPDIWWDREVYSQIDEIETHDPSVPAADRKPVLTHALTEYSDFIEQQRTRTIMVAEFNVATQGDVVDLTRKFDQGVNKTDWSFQGKVIPQRSALIKEVSGGLPTKEGQYTFIPIVMRIAFAHKDQTWDVPKPELSQTHFVKDSSGSGDYTLVNGFRKRVDAGSLVPINADGTRRSEELEVLITDWRIRREVNFTDLPFIPAA